MGVRKGPHQYRVRHGRHRSLRDLRPATARLVSRSSSTRLHSTPYHIERQSRSGTRSGVGFYVPRITRCPSGCRRRPEAGSVNSRAAHVATWGYHEIGCCWERREWGVLHAMDGRSKEVASPPADRLPRGVPASFPEVLDRTLRDSYEFVILGAGCAGLSLCYYLLEEEVDDPREETPPPSIFRP